MYQRKDGRWCDTANCNGKTKFFYGKSPAEVKRKMAAYREEQDKGVFLPDAIDEWLVYKEPLVAYNTYAGYQTSIKKINAKFSNTRINELNTAQIHSFLQGLADSGLGKTSVERCYDVLNDTYRYFINKEGSTTNRNPCDAVKMPRGLKSEKRELADEADIEIIKKSVDLPFGLFAYLLIYSGLRKGEALALTDKSFYDGIIDVVNQVVWQPNKPVITKLKTKNSKRKVPVLDALQEVLPTWEGYLFSNDGGKTPLGRKEFVRLWEQYCKDAGLADKTVITTKGKNGREFHRTEWSYHLVPHQLRHEFATLCLDADIIPKDAADLMGHSTPAITEKVYQHIRDSRRTQSANKLNSYVNSKR